MSKMGVEAVDRIQMVRCHYLNNNKQIIDRFHSFADRERVWKKRFNMKHLKINICMSPRISLLQLLQKANNFTQFLKLSRLSLNTTEKLLLLTIN